MTETPATTSGIPREVLTHLQTMGEAALRHLGEPDEVLTHDDRGPYLEKWRIRRHADGSAVLIHRFLRSDGDQELHSHPWDNLTIVIAGGYWDVTAAGRRWLGPGEILQRKAGEFHRVELEPGVTPITLFRHGPKINHWGFLGSDGVVVPHEVYLATSGGRKLAA